MAKIKSGAYYMLGEAVFRVIGLDRTGWRSVVLFGVAAWLVLRQRWPCGFERCDGSASVVARSTGSRV